MMALQRKLVCGEALNDVTGGDDEIKNQNGRPARKKGSNEQLEGQQQKYFTLFCWKRNETSAIDLWLPLSKHDSSSAVDKPTQEKEKGTPPVALDLKKQHAYPCEPSAFAM